MKDTLIYIISAIVDSPSKVHVDEEETGGVITFTVSVAKEDMGKVIGKEGKVIRAIRSLMRIPAIKQNKKINITLQETE